MKRALLLLAFVVACRPKPPSKPEAPRRILLGVANGIGAIDAGVVDAGTPDAGVSIAPKVTDAGTGYVPPVPKLTDGGVASITLSGAHYQAALAAQNQGGIADIFAVGPDGGQFRMIIWSDGDGGLMTLGGVELGVLQ